MKISPSLSFIHLGWWILKSSNDPSVAGKLMLETCTSSRYRYLFDPTRFYTYESSTDSVRDATTGVITRRVMLCDDRRLLITDPQLGIFYKYEKIYWENLQLRLFALIVFIMMGLEISILYTEMQWLSIIFSNQNRL